MKISELRELLDRTSSEDAKRILIEVYRVLPKKTRENLAIDELVKNPSGAASHKQAKKLAHKVDIDYLEAELEQFLSDAYAQNYFAPNRFVPKSERPKWRFIVKRLFKEINSVVVEPGSIEKAGMLLEKLYQMLCYACDFVLFSAYDPFQSVGISQTAFLDAVLGLKAEHLELHKFIDHGLHLVRDSRLNRYTLGSNLVQVLIDRLRTPESLELAIERAAHLHSETNSGPERKQNYERADRRNRLAEFGFLAYVKLSDYDRAIDFFLARYIASDKEISLFVLLERLRALQREDLWQREYERAIQTGIRPRDRLADAYRHLKSHGQLPAYY
ncbi:MAG: hypothetical protein WB586_30210 [Chthoniobacterales bacterium]